MDIKRINERIDDLYEGEKVTSRVAYREGAKWASGVLEAENAKLKEALKQCADCLEDVANKEGGWAWEEVLAAAREALKGGG